MAIVRKPLLSVSLVALLANSGAIADEYAVFDISQGTSAVKYSYTLTATAPEGTGLKTEKLVMRKIPAGTFKMGGTTDVTIEKPFYIGVYEITKKQYALLTGVTGIGTQTGDDEPVNGVSYNMLRGSNLGSGWPNSSAVDEGTLISVLRTKTGVGSFDLPTEAQWEYACRAGTTSLYNNGGNSEDDLKLLGRYRGNSNDGKGNCEGLVPVGYYLPNAWGLYDMHGNIFEWTLDRCVRGGCCDYLAYECTSSARFVYGVDNASDFFGVRVVCLAESLESSTPASPVVSAVTAKQHYPWCGKIDIGYTVSGATDGLVVKISVKDNDNSVTYEAKTFDTQPTAAVGSHSLVWDATKDGVNKVSKNMVATVSLVVAE